MTRLRRIAIAAAALVIVFLAYEVASSFIAYTSDAYVRSDLVAVAPEVSGRIIAVSVKDNQTVEQGDLLATIDPVPFQLAVDQHQAEVDEARAQVAADQDSIASAQANLASAQAAALYASENQARTSVLTNANDASRADLQKADDDLRQARAAVDAAEAAIAKAQATASMHQASQARAQAELGTAAWQLSRTKILSPVSGTINNLTVRPGDTGQIGVPLIGIVDAHAWRIMANFKQDFIRGFKEGDTAWVWLDTQPWRLHRARVAGVARAINREPANEMLLPYVAPTVDWIRLQRRFPVTLTLVDPPAAMPLYMGADARVLILP
jgi:multidrug efflux system membrane fusion protein